MGVWGKLKSVGKAVARELDPRPGGIVRRAQHLNKLRRVALFDERRVMSALKKPGVKSIAWAGLEVAGATPFGKLGKGLLLGAKGVRAARLAAAGGKGAKAARTWKPARPASEALGPVVRRGSTVGERAVAAVRRLERPARRAQGRWDAATIARNRRFLRGSSGLSVGGQVGEMAQWEHRLKRMRGLDPTSLPSTAKKQRQWGVKWDARAALGSAHKAEQWTVRVPEIRQPDVTFKTVMRRGPGHSYYHRLRGLGRRGSMN